MNPLGHIGAMNGTEQVEISGVIPVTHDAKPVEQRNIMLLRGHTQSVIDLIESPDETGRLLQRCGEVYRQITDEALARLIGKSAALLDPDPALDHRAPGGAVTVVLCGSLDHEPPCPVAADNPGPKELRGKPARYGRAVDWVRSRTP